MRDAPFFIVASPRSGTTLLERMINRHSRLFVPPETAFFHILRRQGLLYLQSSQESLKKFVDYYISSRPAKLLGLDKMQYAPNELLRNAKSNEDVFFNLMRLLQDTGVKPRFGEKTPHHLRCVDYLLKNLPDALFVCIIRDGRAVVRSRLSHPIWEHNLIAATSVWRKDARLLRKLASGEHALRFHIVKYEDMVNRPESELRKICTFLGEEYESTMLNPSYETVIPEPYADYYRQAWMVKSTSPVDPSRATAWLEEYAPSELAMVEHLIAADLAYFGYSSLAETTTVWRPLFVKEWVRHMFWRGNKFAMGRVRR
jgi:hypothetical protein